MPITHYSKGIRGRQGETIIGNWRLCTMRRSSGRIICNAFECEKIDGRSFTYSPLDCAQHDDLAVSTKRATEHEIRRVHEAGLAAFREREPEVWAAAHPDPEAKAEPERSGRPENVIDIPPEEPRIPANFF